MGTQAPAVVALVVACGPTQWLEETLESLAGQDYPNLSVLVVAQDAALAGAVAARLPEAHFALSEGGFAEAANLGMGKVKSAAHVLLCHSDVALAPNAVRMLVEEAYRSNAGVTCPKLVAWEAPERLLSVGLGADRLGNLQPLVEAGELDQGQHDAVREVFVAPGGAVLVRSDLWRALGGYVVAYRGRLLGDDLELSWRAQLVGARVVVAPQAVARHRQACPKGGGPQSPSRDDERLRVLWACYGWKALGLVLPVAVLLAFLGTVWRLATRRPQPWWPLVALGQSVRSPRELRQARRSTQALRRVSDFSLWGSRRGSARLRPTFSRRALMHGALGALASGALGTARAEAAAARGGPGGPQGAREGTRAGQAPALEKPEGLPALGWEWPAGVAAVVVALVLAGCRGLLAGSIPHVGDLPTGGVGLGSWWGAWWSGPGTPGLGGASPGPPGLLFMALVGSVCFGSTAIAAHVLLLAPLLLGPLGAYFAARRFGSRRGQLAAGVVYAALPLPYNSIALGHFAGLVAYGAAPWLLTGLCSTADAAASGGQLAAGLARGWRHLVYLALVLGAASAFAPAMVMVALLIGIGLAAGSLLAGGPGAARSALSQLVVALVVSALALVLLLPWASQMALRSPGGAPIGLGHLLGLRTGPYGGGLTWALLGAAGVSLFIGRGSRLVLAVRMWAVALASLAAAWAWSPAGGLELLLAPAGAALASCVALGAASVEADLSGYRFGWRQFAPALGMAAALASVLPLFAWAASGRFDLPSSGAGASYSFPQPKPGQAYRVLWVGPPASLPMAGGATFGRLAYAASLDGVPSDVLWASPASPLQSAVGNDLAWAQAGETTDLGHLLALAGVRYVAVAVGPQDAGLLSALAHQVDLSEVGIDPAYAVYANSAWLPVFFAVRAGPPARQFLAELRGATQWVAASGVIREPPAPVPLASARPGDLLYGAVPPGSWRLGRALAKTGPLGTVAWGLPASGAKASVPEPAGRAFDHLAALFTLLVWSAAVVSLWVRKRAKLLPAAAAAPPSEEPLLVGVGGQL